MMDRNREARRAAAMANGLPRRRHRTTTSGSLRDSPEDDGPMELQGSRDHRIAKKERDRDIRDRDRDRDRDRERERLSRSKRRRGGDKYLHHGSNREDGGGGGGGGGGDDSSEESVNDEDEEDDDGLVGYVPPSNPLQMSPSAASTLTSHRKSYPPPSKVFRAAPTWKAPDEMIGVSVPRKARSASTKRAHDCWTLGGGVGGEQQIHRQSSASPVRSTTTAVAAVVAAPVPSPLPAPMSPSSSNVSMKKKIKANGGGPKQQKPPKSTSKSSPIQDEIEIEVAEVLYGLMRQSQAPPSKKEVVSNDSANKFDSREMNRSTGDSKSRVSSPIPNSPSLTPLQPSSSPAPPPPQNSSSSAPPFTTVAPKRKRPRPYPDENPAVLGARSNPFSSAQKLEPDQTVKDEAPPLPNNEKNVGSVVKNGDLVNSHEAPAASSSEAPLAAANNGVLSESGGREVVRGEVEEAASSLKTESMDHDHRLDSTSTSIKANSSAMAEKESRREEKFEIDLMASPPRSRSSPERDGEGEDGDGGGMMGDQKSMVTDKEAQTQPKPSNEEDEKGVKSSSSCSSRGGGGAEFNAAEVEDAKANKATVETETHNHKLLQQQQQQLQLQQHHLLHQHQQQQFNLNSSKERGIDLQLDLEKDDRATTVSANSDHKLKLQLQKQSSHPQPPPPPRTTTKDDSKPDKNAAAQTNSMPLPMSVPGGWHGGLPMGYVAPLQGVVSMDGTAMASARMQPPHFLFSQPKPKRCATHCYVARSIAVHQQMMKMNPFWPAAAAAAAAPPLFSAKPPYNMSMVPSADLHAAAAAAAAAAASRGVTNSAEDKGQAFAFFPGQPASKEKSSQSSNVPDGAQKKQQQFLLPQSLPPGPASNVLHAPAFFFPFGQQQPSASARPSSTKSAMAAGSAASTTASNSTPMGASTTAGPAMSFSYPNMGGNETQFMAILGNSPYPFPIPAQVGAAAPYRGSHPQAMSFFNGSFFPSQMLHPSQLQQQQPGAPAQSMQIQQQNHPNASICTASSSSPSQKHLQNQQQRPQASAANGGAGTPNPSLQNFQVSKGRPSQPQQHDMGGGGGEDSPSTADSRTRPNLGVYGQNFAMPFHSPNFAMMTSPSAMAGNGSNSAAVPNGNYGDKKQHQQQQQQSQQQALKSGIETLTPPFPMSFAAASMNGTTAPGFDLSSMAHNHPFLQSLPESARHNYQLMAAAAQAAQAAHQKKNNYHRGGSEDGNPVGSSSVAADPYSVVDEERKALTARASAATSMGQSIAFSRDLAENSISAMPGNNVVDSSARSLNLAAGSSRPTRTSTNSNASNSEQQQQQQQSQMLFSKQQQFVAATVAAARNKTQATSNGYPDHLTSSSVMAAKYSNALPGFPPLVQSSGTPGQSSQWKNSIRPNTSQVSSPSIAAATSTASTFKNLSQQQGRPQQSHTQISFGAAVAAANPKPSTTSQGQQTQNSSNHQATSPPMMVGSPSTSSISKSAGGSPRTTTSTSAGNKAAPQGSTLSSQQQGKNSTSPSLSSQKPSILGTPHMMSTMSSSASKPPQMQDSQQQPQLSKQSIQQAQLFFSNAYMQASANASAAAAAAAAAGSGYYLQRHRPENHHHQQQQQQGSKSQGSGGATSVSSGMLSLSSSSPMLGNASTSDPAKAVAAAAASGMKGGLPSQGMFHAAAQFAQSTGGGTHQLVPAGFPYVHAVPTTVQVKPAEQKQPAGE